MVRCLSAISIAPLLTKISINVWYRSTMTAGNNILEKTWAPLTYVNWPLFQTNVRAFLEAQGLEDLLADVEVGKISREDNVTDIENKKYRNEKAVLLVSRILSPEDLKLVAGSKDLLTVLNRLKAHIELKIGAEVSSVVGDLSRMALWNFSSGAALVQSFVEKRALMRARAGTCRRFFILMLGGVRNTERKSWTYY